MTHRVLKWLMLLALVLLIVSFISFWFRGPSFRDKDVVLEIEGPTQAIVGEEVVYKLKYSNDTKIDLKNLKFTFYYPAESVVIKNGVVQSDLTDKFEVDSLSSGQKEEREFRAFMVGDRGDIKDAKVNLSFKAGTLTSSFEKQFKLSTTIVSVPVAITLVSPPNIVPGQTVSYILDYRNESAGPIADLLFEFDYPDGFAPKEFSPNPDEGQNKWRLPSLRKGGGGRITIQGKLDGVEGETKSVSVMLKRKIDNQYIDFEKASSVSVVSNALLEVGILVNDSRNYVANPGDTLNYSIDYKNTSTTTFSDINLSVKLDGEMLDLSTLDTKGGFFDSSTRTIIWNSSNTSNFSNFSPNTRGSVKFSVKLKSSSSLEGSNTLFVRSTAKLSTPNVPENVDGREVSATANLVTNITSQPTLTQLIYYNDPNFGSNGPLPPEVGKETVFTIHWQITNPGNDLNDARMTATLPAGVTWKNVFSSNLNLHDPAFNKNSSEVSWGVVTLPHGVGTSMPKYELAFQVTIKPSTADKDRVMDLIKDVKLVGVDSVTKQNIVVRASNMTTSDLVDRPGEGTVK